MKLVAIISICAIAQSASAANVASPCKDVEYMQLKIGEKAELLREYCFAKIHAESEDRMHKITEETIAQKRAIPSDTSEDEQDSMAYLKSAASCRSRAAQLQVALSKRFKTKPPKSCD